MPNWPFYKWIYHLNNNELRSHWKKRRYMIYLPRGVQWDQVDVFLQHGLKSECQWKWNFGWKKKIIYIYIISLDPLEKKKSKLIKSTSESGSRSLNSNSHLKIIRALRSGSIFGTFVTYCTRIRHRPNWSSRRWPPSGSCSRNFL